MSAADSFLPAYWQFYSERARQADLGRLDDIGYGREELLWETLAMIESGVPFTDGCHQRLDQIPWNRAKKYRRLGRCLLESPARAGGHETATVDVADSVDQVRGMLSPDEWEVERRLAGGQTYAEIAANIGLSPDALKVRASRWRARIRSLLPFGTKVQHPLIR
jgi:hypothetical protein